MTIKSRDIFFIINEVNYVLALSNETQQIVDMVLDRLMPLLKLDCSWVQLVDPETHDLQLVACRGFTPEMMQVAALPASEQGYISQVAMGLRLVIPDLARDGSYGLSSFSRAGLRSLIAVPIRTYRTHGVLGIASHARKRFPRESDELLMIIAGMIGTAINTAELGRVALASQERRMAAVHQPLLHREDKDTNNAEARSDDHTGVDMALPAAVTVAGPELVAAGVESDGWLFNKSAGEAGMVRDEKLRLVKDISFAAPDGVSLLNDEAARRIGLDMLKASLISLSQAGSGRVAGGNGDRAAGKNQAAIGSREFNKHDYKMAGFRNAHRAGKTSVRGKK